MGDVLDNPAASRRASAVRAPAWVRWLLARWWALVALVGAALVTQIVLVLLSQPPEKWLPEIAKQLATVLSLARTYPAVAAVGALAFVAITVLGYAAHKAVEATATKYIILKEWPGELPPGPAVPPAIPAPITPIAHITPR